MKAKQSLKRTLLITHVIEVDWSPNWTLCPLESITVWKTNNSWLSRGLKLFICRGNENMLIRGLLLKKGSVTVTFLSVIMRSNYFNIVFWSWNISGVKLYALKHYNSFSGTLFWVFLTSPWKRNEISIQLSSPETSKSASKTVQKKGEPVFLVEIMPFLCYAPSGM